MQNVEIHDTDLSSFVATSVCPSKIKPWLIFPMNKVDSFHRLKEPYRGTLNIAYNQLRIM